MRGGLVFSSGPPMLDIRPDFRKVGVFLQLRLKEVFLFISLLEIAPTVADMGTNPLVAG